MVIVLFSKSCKKVIHVCHFKGSNIYRAFDKAKELIEKHKDAWYYEIFTEKEYKAKFE